jgi:hypothetical protein
MRSILALGLLVILCASANAATVHRSKPATVHHLHTRQHVIVRPSEGVTPGFAVPGRRTDAAVAVAGSAGSRGG